MKLIYTHIFLSLLLILCVPLVRAANYKKIVIAINGTPLLNINKDPNPPPDTTRFQVSAIPLTSGRYQLNPPEPPNQSILQAWLPSIFSPHQVIERARYWLEAISHRACGVIAITDPLSGLVNAHHRLQSNVFDVTINNNTPYQGTLSMPSPPHATATIGLNDTGVAGWDPYFNGASSPENLLLRYFFQRFFFSELLSFLRDFHRSSPENPRTFSFGWNNPVESNLNIQVTGSEEILTVDAHGRVNEGSLTNSILENQNLPFEPALLNQAADMLFMRNPHNQRLPAPGEAGASNN
ncbi:hypothetical protein [Endozoicomonas euniceicola]|uniref:Uncharacterized protein n=1 Tax=Endozoicomonas euniceicola TaxID=1234143 RepID=A0ABY6GXX8_9GAMM|nr:hypothetical protein [Endozoicomonas euniceicola]UYM17535.1 hypothetical protein NX720_06360 [Endozoicomonas euniceicola]